MSNLERTIKDLVIFYVKENYKKYIKENKIEKIEKEKIKSVISDLYCPKKILNNLLRIYEKLWKMNIGDLYDNIFLAYIKMINLT